MQEKQEASKEKLENLLWQSLKEKPDDPIWQEVAKELQKLAHNNIENCGYRGSISITKKRGKS